MRSKQIVTRPYRSIIEMARHKPPPLLVERTRKFQASRKSPIKSASQNDLEHLESVNVPSTSPVTPVRTFHLPPFHNLAPSSTLHLHPSLPSSPPSLNRRLCNCNSFFHPYGVRGEESQDHGLGRAKIVD